jgi:hypothetical protein
MSGGFNFFTMDEPREHYRGTYLPVSLMRLYEAGTLNGEEVLLFAKIDALQDPKAGGCWASNEYLAKWWKKTDRWVSVTIAKFRDLGIVQVIPRDGLTRVVVIAGDPRRKLLPTPEENFRGPQKKTSAKVPLREGETTRGDDRPVADVLLPGLGADATQLSPAVTEFANWSRRHGYHVRVPGANPTYSKGGGPGGWSRATLIRWEEAYRALCARHGNGKVNKTLKRFLRWYESEYAPVVHTLTSFTEKFDRIHKFVEKEKAIRERNGEDPDDLDHPEVQLRTVNKGTVKQIAEVE